MSRLRLLVGLLGCLAVLAAALPTIAIASAPMQTAASEPCEPCPDCNGGPCDSTAARCFQACATATPTLGMAVFVLTGLDFGQSVWTGLQTPLRGQTPPPDPFPPKS